MKHDLKAGIRYAKSLFELAQERNEVEAVHADMATISQAIEGSRDLEVVLRSPIINVDKKLSIVREIFTKNIGKTALRFIELLVEKRREMHIVAIARSFNELYKIEKHIETATVVTATPLDAAGRAKIIKIVADKTGKQIELIEKVDAEVIGGFKLTFNNQMIDASIQTEIQQLRIIYNQNPFIKNY